MGIAQCSNYGCSCVYSLVERALFFFLLAIVRLIVFVLFRLFTFIRLMTLIFVIVCRRCLLVLFFR